jgi:hypothetical protein
MYQSALLLCLVSPMLCSFVAMYGLLDLVRTSCMTVLCYAPDGSDAMYALLPVGPVTLFVTLGHMLSPHVMLSLVFCPVAGSCVPLAYFVMPVDWGYVLFEHEVFSAICSYQCYAFKGGKAPSVVPRFSWIK